MMCLSQKYVLLWQASCCERQIAFPSGEGGSRRLTNEVTLTQIIFLRVLRALLISDKINRCVGGPLSEPGEQFSFVMLAMNVCSKEENK